MFVKVLAQVVTLVGLLLSLLHAVAPDLLPAGWALGAIVLLGLIYGGTAIDPENATDYIAVVLAATAASATDTLSHLPLIGYYMDAVLDNVATGILASTVTVLASRTVSRLTRRRKR